MICRHFTEPAWPIWQVGFHPSYQEENPMTNTSNSLNAKQAKVILQFLQRTQLQGAEMPAYVDAFNCLSVIAQQDEAEAAVPASE